MEYTRKQSLVSQDQLLERRRKSKVTTKDWFFSWLIETIFLCVNHDSDSEKGSCCENNVSNCHEFGKYSLIKIHILWRSLIILIEKFIRENKEIQSQSWGENSRKDEEEKIQLTRKCNLNRCNIFHSRNRESKLYPNDNI